MMNLDELLGQGWRCREEFEKRHPYPFLLLITPVHVLAWCRSSFSTQAIDNDTLSMAKTAEWSEQVRDIGQSKSKSNQRLVWAVRALPSSAFQSRIHVGRTAHSDIQIPHRAISKLHAYFEPAATGDGYVLTDAGSRNGTRLGDLTLTPHQEQLVGVGMTMSFGPVAVTFCNAAYIYGYVGRLDSEKPLRQVG